MQVVFAVLADQAIQNRVRKMALELFCRYHAPLNAALLPAHVSLKQGFTVPEIDVIEAYFNRFAASIQPFTIEFDQVYYAEWNGNGIIGLRVREYGVLRALHNRLNDELGALFGDVTAPHDGEAYRFHLTVEMGPLDPDNPYQRYYEALPSTDLALSYTAREITLFVDPCESDSGRFLAYKTLYLGQAEE